MKKHDQQPDRQSQRDEIERLRRRIAELEAAAAKPATDDDRSYRELVDFLPQTVFEIDAQGRLTYVNRYGLEFYGYGADYAVAGINILDLVIENDRPRVVANIQSRIRGDVTVGNEYTTLKKDGTPVNAMIYSVPVMKNGAITGFRGIMIDITERIAAEERLRASEELFHGVFATAPVAIFIWDRSFRITEWNPCAERLLGWSRAEAIGRDFIELVIPAGDRERIGRRARSLLNDQAPVRGVSAAQRRDGTTITVEWENAIIYDRAGALSGVLSIGLDITERQRAEEGQKRLTAILEQTSDLVSTAHPDGRLLYLNRAGRIMAGWGRDESLAGKTIPDLHPAWAWELIRDTGLPQTRLDGTWQGETSVLHRDGTETPVSQVIIAHHGPGGVEFFSTIMRDITELKLNEFAMRESEERFRRMAENIQDGLTIVERGHVVYANKRACEIFGINRDEMLRFTGIEVAAPDERDRLRVIMNESVRSGVSPQELEFWIERPDGTRRCIHNRYSLSLKGEEVIGRYVITTDVTDRRIAEEARINLERQILHSQKLESLGVLAGGIAHDFNNLLMAIQGNIDLAQQTAAPAGPGREFLHEAMVASRRAAELTRQMLAYSGKGTFVVEHLNLSEHVDELAHLLRTTVPRTIELQTILDHDVPLIEADPAQIQQVVMNLITNAAEAIGDGAGRIRVKTGLVHATAADMARSRLDDRPSPGDYVFIEVSDTGCGMDEDTQHRLFEPFFSTKFTGRGLGMSAVLGIMRSHRGAIMLESAPGRGTSFRVLFPAVAAGTIPRESAAVPASPSAPADHAGRILLVDDEELVREVARKMLEHLGYAVVTASSGFEALDRYRAAPGSFNCVILDLTMPGMDGVATFRELKAINAAVRVVLSSGYSEQEVASRFGINDMAGFIQKPYQLTHLSTVVHQVLRR